jgi:hypothetical protein
MIFSLDHLYCSLTIDAFKNQTNDSSSDVMSEKRQDRSRGSLKERGRQAFVAFSRNLGFHAGVFKKRDGLRKAPLENGSRRTWTMHATFVALLPSFKGMLSLKNAKPLICGLYQIFFIAG